MLRTSIVFTIALATAASAALRPVDSDMKVDGHKSVAVYKTTPQGDLKIFLYFPPDWSPTIAIPAGSKAVREKTLP